MLSFHQFTDTSVLGRSVKDSGIGPSWNEYASALPIAYWARWVDCSKSKERNSCTESKNSIRLSSLASAGLMAVSGSFTAMLQRNMGLEIASITVPRRTSPGGHTPASARRDTATPEADSGVNMASYTSGMSTAIVPHSANSSISGGIGIERMRSAKRKHGRPRQYVHDGGLALGIAPLVATPSSPSPSQKRGRGRPPGSGRIQQLAALGELMATTAGAGFTPHAVTIAAGEDVATKIMSFSQQGPRGICILSANGAISNVTLRQPATSGGTVTYEGRFEILSLSGSFLLTESGGTRTGGLSVSLAGPDGRVIGGGVAGLLMAASPVQVVVGSFMSNTRKLQTRPGRVEGSTGVSPIAAAGTPAYVPEMGSSIDEAVDIKPPVLGISPLNQTSRLAASTCMMSTQGQGFVVPGGLMGWSASQALLEEPNTDIDISLPGG